MRALSPDREEEIRAARNRRRRDWRRRTKAQLLRDLKEFFGIPVQRRPRRQPAPVLRPELPIAISSGDSSDEAGPVPDRQLVVVNLSETLEELPDIDPRPRRATIQQAELRQAHVVLERLSEDLILPQLHVLPATPPSDSPLAIDWNQLEYQLAVFDDQEPRPPQQEIQPPQPPIDFS